MNDYRQQLQEDQERLLRDMRALVEDAEALLRHAGEGASEGYREARARLEQRVQATRERLANAHASARARASEHAETVMGYAREHPWEVIGVGVGLGVLAGLLFTGRRGE